MCEMRGDWEPPPRWGRRCPKGKQGELDSDGVAELVSISSLGGASRSTALGGYYHPEFQFLSHFLYDDHLICHSDALVLRTSRITPPLMRICCAIRNAAPI